MRILIVTDQFPPVTFGGMAQHAWHIARMLGERHAVRVLVARSQKADWGKVPFDVSPSLSMRFPELDAISILWTARAFKANVIHFCNAALSYRPVSRYYPTVTRVVGNDFLRPWCGYGLPLRSLLYRFPGDSTKVRVKELETRIRKSRTIARLQQVDAIVANSEWTREQLIVEGIPKSHVHVIVGGVDTEVFQPCSDKSQVRGEIGLPTDGLVILTAANLVRKKGIDTVLRVVADLAPKWPSLRYVIVGDGEDETCLRDLATDLDVRDRIVFAGRKTQEELCRYYQAADLYVQVSRNHRLENGYIDVETMGRTYMEAGASGLPVVAARVGGVPSVVRDNVNGLLVRDPQDQDEIAAAIDRLLADEGLRQRMGNAGLKMARERFSWERVVAAFEEVMVAVVAPWTGDAVRGSELGPSSTSGSGHWVRK
jgi:glycosyltransferase involved in cell wall biosynthesis